jgi:hypothetical protein
MGSARKLSKVQWTIHYGVPFKMIYCRFFLRSSVTLWKVIETFLEAQKNSFLRLTLTLPLCSLHFQLSWRFASQIESECIVSQQTAIPPPTALKLLLHEPRAHLFSAALIRFSATLTNSLTSLVRMRNTFYKKMIVILNEWNWNPLTILVGSYEDNWWNGCNKKCVREMKFFKCEQKKVSLL